MDTCFVFFVAETGFHTYCSDFTQSISLDCSVHLKNVYIPPLLIKSPISFIYNVLMSQASQQTGY